MQDALACLVSALAAGPSERSGSGIKRPTSGVSYVLQTESKQLGADGFAALPHLVIRPPAPPELPDDHPGLAAVLEVLRSAHTGAVVLPLKEENSMKQYLLDPSARAATLQACGGRRQDIHGSTGLDSMLQDRSFVCLHYRMDDSGAGTQLLPCMVLEHSNVQVGVMVRKGVGGTCPLRAAARKASASGPLSALLDDPPDAVLASVAQAHHHHHSCGIVRQASGSDGGEDAVESSADPVLVVPAHQRISFATLSCRLELYVAQETWESLRW